jgi:hypothetical protein
LGDESRNNRTFRAKTAVNEFLTDENCAEESLARELCRSLGKVTGQELAACPFCGCEASMREADSDGPMWAECDMCSARTAEGQYPDNVAQWWNMRFGPEAADKLEALSGRISWQPIETAPRDGTLVLLLVDYSEGEHWIDDEPSGLGRTIGHNNDENVGEGEGQGWQFAGWCWTHDHYVEGVGQPTHWMPLPEPPAALAQTQSEG